MIEEKRIYVIVADTIFAYDKTVVQPAGRQIAQACHVVCKLRWLSKLSNGEPITTIILQARDSAELTHVQTLAQKKKLNPVVFLDDNLEYGPGRFATAAAFLATKSQTLGICDYLPMWGSK